MELRHLRYFVAVAEAGSLTVMLGISLLQYVHQQARAAWADLSMDKLIEQRPWYNPDLRSRWFFVPGIVGSLTLVLVVNLTAFAVVGECEIGTLEQIMVTPIPLPSSFSERPCLFS